MASLNRITLIGNLGDDPELITTPSGSVYARASLATTYRRKDKEGKVKEKTDWHRLVFFGKNAENAAEYLRKGNQTCVEGRISYDTNEKDGVKQYFTNIIVDQVTFIHTSRDGDKAAAPQTNAPAAPPAAADINEDDIPF